MNRLDDFVLDRLFQPVADALAERTSCFGLARSCAVGAFLFNALTACAAIVADRAWPILLLAHAVMGAFALHDIAEAARKERRRQQDGTYNPERAKSAFWRTAWLIVVMPWSAYALARRPELASLLWLAMTTCTLGTKYFMACRDNPPPRRVVERRLAWSGA